MLMKHKHQRTKEEWKELYDKMSNVYKIIAPILLEKSLELYKDAPKGTDVHLNILLDNVPPHIQIYQISLLATDDTKNYMKSKYPELTEIVNEIAKDYGLKRKTIDGYDGSYCNGKFMKVEEGTDLTLVFK